LSYIKRQLNALRYNLQHSNSKEETTKRVALHAEERRLLEIDARGPPRRKEMVNHKRFIKYNPSTWKLWGAVQLAWKVYDFDTRYVCPHLKNFRDADSKAKLVQNIFHKHRGQFLESSTFPGGGNADDASNNSNSKACPPQPQITSFLALLALLYPCRMLSMEAT
jgi:hypothetical protein